MNDRNKDRMKEQTSKIGWTNVPAREQTIGILGTTTIDDPETTRDMRRISEQMTEEDIKSGMAWLEEHREQYAFIEESIQLHCDGEGETHVPYTRYQRYGGN